MEKLYRNLIPGIWVFLLPPASLSFFFLAQNCPADLRSFGQIIAWVGFFVALGLVPAFLYLTYLASRKEF